MSDDLLDAVRALHARVDAESARLTATHQDRLQCRRGCHECCQDGLSVGPAEALRIRTEFPEVLASPPRAPGACALLDAEGACRIYAARPQICRTQGLPMVGYSYDPVCDNIQEARSICPLNAAGPALEDLAEHALWHDGAAGLELANLAADHGLDPEARIALRELFRS